MSKNIPVGPGTDTPEKPLYTREEVLSKANVILDKALSMNENEVALNCLHFIYHVQRGE